MSHRQALVGVSLEPLLNAAGAALPPATWFPQSPQQLIDATVPQLNPLLNFYGLAVSGNRSAKVTRLRKHLGDMRN